MNNIPLHDDTTGFFVFCFFWLVFVSVRNYLLVSGHLNYFYFSWLWILLLWTFVCRYIVEYLFEVLLDIYSGVEIAESYDNSVFKFLRTFPASTPLCNPLFFSLPHLPHSKTMAKGDGVSLPSFSYIIWQRWWNITAFTCFNRAE